MPDFCGSFARPTIGIVPAGSGSDSLRDRLIGTGPFRFVSAEQDDNVVLERNDQYFGDAPKISRVRFRVVPEAIVRALELRKGTADVEVNSLTPDMIPVLRQQSTVDVTRIIPEPIINTWLSILTMRRWPSAKCGRRWRMRRTAKKSFAILYRGQAHAADGPLPKSSWAYEPGHPALWI